MHKPLARLKLQREECKMRNCRLASGGSPALAVFNDKLYCVHEGQNGDGWLWFCSFDGEKWSDDTKLAMGTSASPAIAVYNGKLYCVREGQNGDGLLWFCSFDGENWSDDKKLPNGTGSSRPGYPPAALAVYQDKLYCVHEGQHGDGWLWFCSFDGENWSNDTKMDRGTSAGPALVVLNNLLYCLHEGQNQDGWLWYTSYDGVSWSKDGKLQQSVGIQPADVRGKGDGLGITGPPALNVTDELLYILHHGQSEQGWMWGIVADGDDKGDRMMAADDSGAPMGTSFSPGLALYKNAFHVLHHGKDRSGWLWSFTQMANQPQPSEFNLEMPERPGAPYGALDRYDTHLTRHQEFGTPDYPVEVMRHHIIPDSRLRDLWNRMLAQNQLHIASEELLLTIDQNLEQYQQNQMRLHEDDITHLRALLQAIRTRTIRHNPTAPRPQGFDDLAAVYEWLPGNLFIGPRGGGGQYQRTDDPGDGFEENANTIIGADFPHQETNRAIEEYLRSGSDGSARQAFAGLARIAGRRLAPYALNSIDWIYAHGKYQLRRRGDFV